MNTTKQLKRAEIKKVSEIVTKFARRGYYKYQDPRVGGCRVIYKSIVADITSESDLRAKLEQVIDSIANAGFVGWSVDVDNKAVRKNFVL